jgi:CubicO group peptidase (beta-lactamase class C family)
MEKVTTNTTFRLASCTKLMTSMAALQCGERGQIALDDDVSAVLTELKDIQILTGLNDEGPIFKKVETK